MELTPQGLFALVNPLALTGWLLLLFVPKHRLTERVVHSGNLSLVLSGIYLLLIAFHIGNSHGGNFSTLDGVSLMFTNPWLLLAGWVHYLAFDLWVGSWEVKEAAKRKVPRALLSVCLVLTFMFGPIGFLAFKGIERARR
jgi:hypothetical protein